MRVVAILALVASLFGVAAMAPTVDQQVFDSNGVTQVIQCDQKVVINSAGAATTALVAVSGSKTVFVCQFAVTMVGAAAPNTIKLLQGTGVACAGAPADLTGTFKTSVTVGAIVPVAFGNGIGAVLRTSAAGGLCMTTTTADAINGFVSFAQR